jgi:hypothetical protein
MRASGGLRRLWLTHGFLRFAALANPSACSLTAANYAWSLPNASNELTTMSDPPAHRPCWRSTALAARLLWD